MSKDVQIIYEATPNPHSMKFIATVPISSEACNFTNSTEAANSPLALKIFGFPWAAGVFIGSNFVTITKQEWVDWDILADPLAELLREHLERGEPIFTTPLTLTPEEDENPSDSPIVQQIKRILRDEIRPAVAMDGGDVSFHKFEDGRVYLEMQGACSGCPSSSYTLKEGIETRLKSSIPEIMEVIGI